MTTPNNPGDLYVLEWVEGEGKDRHPGWNPQYNPQGFAINSGVTRHGALAALFVLNERDDPISSGIRAELSAPCCPGEPTSAERWYGFSIFLSDWSCDFSGEIVTQWHQDDNSAFQGAPPLAIMTKAGEWWVTVRESFDDPSNPSSVDRPIGRYLTDVWTDWVVHVKWCAGDDGLIQIWRNKDLVYDDRGKNKCNDGLGNYMKCGIYKWDWLRKQTDTKQRIMYYDELRIADVRGSYEVVAPPPPVPRSYPDDNNLAICQVIADGGHLGGTSATIAWVTSREADSQVVYGHPSLPWESYPETELDLNLVTQHSVALSVWPDSPYRFRIKSKDRKGNLATHEGYFYNPPSPPVAPPAAGSSTD